MAGKKLTQLQILNYQLTQEDRQMLDGFARAMAGEFIDMNGLAAEKCKIGDQEIDIVHSIPKMQDFLATPSAQVLMPRVVIGAMREVSEPMYIASKFLQKVRLKSGSMMVFPSMGTIARAYDLAEAQEIPEETMDWQTHESTEVRIGKVGLRLRVTDEMISDSQWDIIAMMIKAAGRALARHKEKKIFTAFTKHGHNIIDNKSADPRKHTTGLDKDGNPNNTLAAEDLLDIIIGVMANEYNPTDLIMHPLSWTVFARDELTGGLTINNQMGGMLNHKNYPKGGSFAMGPSSIQGRLPFAFNVNLSPFAHLDKKEKTFDITCLDKDNVGVLLQKTDLQVEKFDEPARDLQNMKFVERYGVGILNEGRGVVTAKNISMEKSYPEIMRVKSIQV